MENDKTTCRTCKHRQRWMNDFSPKVTQVCELKKGRTPMGFKKIKVTDVACERYERGIDMEKIKQRADDYVGHPEEIDEFSSAAIKRQAFIDGARAQRSIDNEYFRQKIKKAILWLKCRSEFPFSDSMLDSFGQFMEDKI